VSIDVSISAEAKANTASAGGWYERSVVPLPIGPARPLILGSASPRRRDILSGLGIPIQVMPADVDETLARAEEPLAYVERVVGAKLAAVAARAGQSSGAGILVADTIVVLDGQVLGKPTDVSDAERLLGRLSGREHRVHTRYAIAAPDGRTLVARTVTSDVRLRAASPESLAGYARTGEGLDKAGAYAIQGIGAFLVESIHGSYSNVVGLPACEVVEDLLATGLLERFP
jgi:septum formation protein